MIDDQDQVWWRICVVGLIAMAPEGMVTLVSGALSLILWLSLAEKLYAKIRADGFSAQYATMEMLKASVFIGSILLYPLLEPK
jgi:hypothetical protein